MKNLFKSKILSIQQHTDRLRSFELTIPKDINWIFLPGQYIDIAFLDEPNKFSGFSLTSTPQDEIISITVQKTFDMNTTHRMFLLSPGDEIFVRGPAGDFTLDCNEIHNIILIAGGIGVTPITSMFRTASKNSMVKQILFFHSAKTINDLLFQNEFRQLSKNSAYCKYFSSLTQQTDWKGKKDRFTVQDILKEIDNRNLNNYHFFICGPGKMNSEFEQGLRKSGINTNNIHIESYYEP